VRISFDHDVGLELREPPRSWPALVRVPGANPVCLPRLNVAAGQAFAPGAGPAARTVCPCGERCGGCRVRERARRLPCPFRYPRQRCSRWLAVFQDQHEFAEVLRHRGLDPGGRERGSKPQHGLGGIEFHLVDKPRRPGPGSAVWRCGRRLCAFRVPVRRVPGTMEALEVMTLASTVIISRPGFAAPPGGPGRPWRLRG
jgi:hypothetical protein